MRQPLGAGTLEMANILGGCLCGATSLSTLGLDRHLYASGPPASILDPHATNAPPGRLGPPETQPWNKVNWSFTLPSRLFLPHPSEKKSSQSFVRYA